MLFKPPTMLFKLLTLASLARASSHLEGRQDIVGTATVRVAEPSGSPENLASGFIYGLRSNEDGSANEDIPADLIEGMGFNYCRAGGAQMANALGWVAGEYEVTHRNVKSIVRNL